MGDCNPDGHRRRSGVTGYRFRWTMRAGEQENAMQRQALALALAFLVLPGLTCAFAPALAPALAQEPPKDQPPPAATPAPAPTPDKPQEARDPFGEETALTERSIVYFKGNGTWDNAFETITDGLKSVYGYLDKEGIKPDGLPMTIFTATDDTGFEYEAAVPISDAPKNPPRGDLALGRSPEGKALKFVHRGSYDDLDNTYEAITNYLDDKRLEAKDMFIEEYVTDPTTTDAKKLVVNVYVVLKPGQASPG
jgi:effector-binding domain-containing protein